MADAVNIAEVAALSGEPTTLVLGGKTFKAGHLSAVDWAVCLNWYKETKVRAVFAFTPERPQADLSNIKSDAVANILCKPFDVWQMIDDVDCVLRLGELCLRQGGEWKGNWEGFKKAAEKVPFREIKMMVMRMSSYWLAEMGGSSENPPQPPLPA